MQQLKRERDRTVHESYLKKVADFVSKDTSGQNEPNKTVVIIRALSLTNIVYFVIHILLFVLMFGKVESVAVLAILVGFVISSIVIFAMSYHGKTTAILWRFIVSALVWILAGVHFWGWDFGVQHFLMMLLILYFFSNYRKYVKKVLFALGLAAMRIWMFFVYNNRMPVLELPSEDIVALQIVNTVAVFWCISLISFICSESSQKLERKLVEYNMRLEIQANTDALTGLCNRRKAMEQLTKMLDKKNSERQFCVCIADIDFFKKINDNYGHDFGDEVLKVLANLFKENVQGQDMVARWGGEEFLFLLAGGNGERALERVEELRKKVTKTAIYKDGKEVHVTMTFGIAEFDQYHGLDATLKEADRKLYLGKERGRDCVIF